MFKWPYKLPGNNYRVDALPKLFQESSYKVWNQTDDSSMPIWTKRGLSVTDKGIKLRVWKVVENIFHVKALCMYLSIQEHC